jgi:hypothetical protein
MTTIPTSGSVEFMLAKGRQMPQNPHFFSISTNLKKIEIMTHLGSY